jgi:hypothetical protein
MGSQVEHLVSSLESLHISCQKPKKFVCWASDVVDNDGKSRLLKEIRGLKRVERHQRREYENLRHLWDETKDGFIPEEYKTSNLTTSSAIFADIIVRLNDLTAKKVACDDHINMRILSLELAASPPLLQV